MSINRVIITGNLTRDGELKALPSGTSVLELRLAVNDRRQNHQTGEWEDVANYVDVTVFGTRADGLAPYLSKGRKIAVEGKLRYSEWQKDGLKRSKLTVIADDIELPPRSQTSQASSAPSRDTSLDSDEIPF